MHRRLPLLAPVLLAVVIAGCGSSSATSHRLKVVATTTQLGDFAREVGGADVDVTQILKPNTDPHEYEPRPSDVTRTTGAKVILTSGDELDHWMGPIVLQSGSSGAQVDVGDQVPVRLPGQTSGPEASRYDPHWWHDPRNAEAGVSAIAAALGTADPDHAATYRANAARYVAKLRTLDHDIAACFDGVPRTQRKLVTDHDAFNYFAARYGITVVGAVIPSQTTQAQPSAGDVAKLVRTIRANHVSAVFPESSVNPKLAQTIARQTGATSDNTLYGDTLGPRGSSGATYLAMEAANADAMVRGFTRGQRGCTIGVR